VTLSLLPSTITAHRRGIAASLRPSTVIDAPDDKTKRRTADERQP